MRAELDVDGLLLPSSHAPFESQRTRLLFALGVRHTWVLTVIGYIAVMAQKAGEDVSTEGMGKSEASQKIGELKQKTGM